jgi:hypothetical protein
MLGSVNAVTEDGVLVAASASASQLGPYASTAGKVILVVGNQKIVPTWRRRSGASATTSLGLGNLIRLTHLDLRNNRVTAVPESPGKLRSLAYLDLRANKLVSLPARIGELTYLEKLDVRWNKLSSHPEWFQRLEQRGCTVYK